MFYSALAVLVEGWDDLAGEELDRAQRFRVRDAPEGDLHRGLVLAEQLAHSLDLLDDLIGGAYEGVPLLEVALRRLRRDVADQLLVAGVLARAEALPAADGLSEYVEVGPHGRYVALYGLVVRLGHIGV